MINAIYNSSLVNVPQHIYISHLQYTHGEYVDIQCSPCGYTMYKYSMYTGTQVHVVLVEHSSHENANTLKITTLHVIGSQVLP